MRIGILETDHLSEDLISIFGSYGKQFTELLQPLDSHLKFECFDVVNQQYPDNIDDCDGYLITGSKSSAYENIPWIARLQTFIVNLNKLKKPLIGICFGHQLIAQTLSGKTEKSNKGWGVGTSEVTLLEAQPWMKKQPDKFTLLISHQDQVIKKPENSQRLAGSAFCPFAALQIEQHILTFQGHPEFTKNYLTSLLNKRRETIGEDVFKQAVQSLSQPVDSALIAEWILDFLTFAIKTSRAGN